MHDSFAFVIHPLDPKRDVGRKFPALGKLPVWLIDFLSVFFPPVFISEIRGVRSRATGNGLQGWLVACPLTPKMMLTLPREVVYRKIVQAGRLAERLGARILGLGAYTSVVGDGGVTVSKHLRLPVTTGDSYTVAISVKALQMAAPRMGVVPSEATAAVVGASGSIGSLCAKMLGPDVATLLLLGRSLDRLQGVKKELEQMGCVGVETSSDLARLAEAQLIISATSAAKAIILPQHLRKGAVVCDVSRPHDVSRLVAEQRRDVLVIEGGMVEVPGPVDFGFDFGIPPGMAYACMAETMALALEQRYESFSLGKEAQLCQVIAIDRIATRHGFRLAGFRSFERAVSESEITAVQASTQLAQPV